MIARIETTLFLLVFLGTLHAQTLKSYEYWIDSDFSNRVTTNSSNSDNNFSLSLQEQNSGVHLLTIRAISPDGMYGAPSCKVFYIPVNSDEKGPLSSYEYWFDNDYSKRITETSSETSIIQNIDISQLMRGVHYYNFRARNSEGLWGGMIRTMFYVPEYQTSNPKMECYEYWFDDDYSGRKIESGNETTITKALDISHLKRGVHYYSIRVKDSNGCWGGIVRSMFYIPEYPGSIPQLGGYEYWFDDDYDGRKSSFSTNPNINLQLSLEKLPYGIHFFNFRERYTDQQLSAPYRSILYYSTPQPADGSKIISYRYQFNSKTTNVVLPAEESSYTIDNLVIPFPETSEYAVINKDCQFSFMNDVVSMHRVSNASFSIQFENKMHEWTMPEHKSFVIEDDITKTPLPLDVEGNVTFDKFCQGDFCAVKLDVASSGYYYLKSSQNVDILIYKDGVLYNDVITSSELKNCVMVGLDEGTYYAIMYNTVMDEDNQEESVILKFSKSKIDDTTTDIALNSTRTGLYVWAKDRHLMISSDYATSITVCNVSGAVVRKMEINEGVNEIRGLSPGIYIVNGKKVILK